MPLTMSTGPSSEHSTPDVDRLQQRGAFILFEGVDRCGKTTQTKLLEQKLRDNGQKVKLIRFPDRTTPTGRTIDKYLTDHKHEVTDKDIHTLFSHNRWEAESMIRNLLKSGTSIVCDRYSYSGIAFSAAKGVPGLSVQDCKDEDRDLPAPDCVIFLDITVDKATQRGGFGAERYENANFQQKVREIFLQLERDDHIPWEMLDATRSIEDLSEHIEQYALKVIDSVKGREVGLMWHSSTDQENVTPGAGHNQ